MSHWQHCRNPECLGCPKTVPHVELETEYYSKHPNCNSQPCDECAVGYADQEANKKIAVATKYDTGKPRLDLIPPEAEEELGKVLAYGAQKYATANWANGMASSRLYAAARRHLGEWNKGIDVDPESGLQHLSHALTNIAFLIWYAKHRPDCDDRWIKQVKK